MLTPPLRLHSASVCWADQRWVELTWVVQCSAVLCVLCALRLAHSLPTTFERLPSGVLVWCVARPLEAGRSLPPHACYARCSASLIPVLQASPSQAHTEVKTLARTDFAANMLILALDYVLTQMNTHLSCIQKLSRTHSLNPTSADMSTHIHTYGVTLAAHRQVSSGSSEHVHMGSLGQRHVNVHSLMSTFHTSWCPVKTNIHSYMGSSTALCVHMYLKQDFCLTFSQLSGKWWWRTESLCKAEISYLNAKCSPGLWLPLVTDGDRNGHKICFTTLAILADPWDPAWDWYVGLRLRARASITLGVF